MQFTFCKVNAFFKSYNILNAYKTKKNSLCEDNELIEVGVDGFEPPTLCL